MHAFSPNIVADADCLEQIQGLAKSLVKDFHRLPYEERLRRLGLDFLNRRRLRADLIVAYKVFFLFRQCGQAGEVIHSKFYRALVSVRYWNRLPTSIVITPSVRPFKHQLDSAWEELFAEVSLFPFLLFLLLSPPPITQSPFTLYQFMLSQPLIHCHS